jgi:hypothetical protein
MKYGDSLNPKAWEPGNHVYKFLYESWEAGEWERANVLVLI